MLQMTKNEFDGKYEIWSDEKLELNEKVSLVGLKGEMVERYIISMKLAAGPATDNKWVYNFSQLSPAARSEAKAQSRYSDSRCLECGLTLNSRGRCAHCGGM